MRRLILAAFLALGAGALAALPATAPAHAQDEANDTRLVTILTAPEPQTQLMAMVLTMQALMQGHEAHILLCGPAGDVALQDAPETATMPQPPRDMSVQGLMKGIMDRGGTVEVCAIYLPGKGLDASALIDGVTAAKPDAMAAAMMAENVRLLSL